MKAQSRRLRPQAGLTLVELGIAALLGVVLLFLAGSFFVTQVRGYVDVRSQAELQTQAKQATQEMIREISNAGAMIPDASRPGFSIASNALSIAYIDARKRYCAFDTDTVKIAFRVRSGVRGDTLVKEVGCNNAAAKPRPLVKNAGPITLGFQYFDAANAVTANRGKVQRVSFSLNLRTKAGRGFFQKARAPQVDVSLANY